MAVVPVALVGYGAIGSAVGSGLIAGAVPGAGLAAVVDPMVPLPPPLHVDSLEAALDRAELVVECAGQDALHEVGPAVIGAGRDLLVLSTGALADTELYERLLAGPGRLSLCTGAIGGLDLLAAAAYGEPFEQVSITTTKTPGPLERPWMSADEVARLRDATEPVELMKGPAREVARAFPATSNVAASVAIAVRNWDVVEATVVADPAATVSRHEIEARSPAGRWRFEVANRPSPSNPGTSGIVPYAVLQAIAVLTREPGGFA